MLSGSWYLEQQVGGAWTRVDKVVLLLPAFQQTHVSDGSSVQLSYSFGAGSDDPIDFRHGDLGIGIQVEQPGDHTCMTAYAGSGDGVPPECQPEIAGTDMAIAGSGLGAAGMVAPAGSGAAGN